MLGVRASAQPPGCTDRCVCGGCGRRQVVPCPRQETPGEQQPGGGQADFTFPLGEVEELLRSPSGDAG